MWKQARESGLSLAELLVVLAITVVLAAILFPAINTPNHSDLKPGADLDPYVASAVEQLDIVPGTRGPRATRQNDHDPVLEGSSGEVPNVVVEVMPAFNTSEVQTLERDGLKEFKTTDISYKLP